MSAALQLCQKRLLHNGKTLKQAQKGLDFAAHGQYYISHSVLCQGDCGFTIAYVSVYRKELQWLLSL